MKKILDGFRMVGSLSNYQNKLNKLVQEKIKVLIWQDDRGEKRTFDSCLLNFSFDQITPFAELLTESNSCFIQDSPIFVYEKNMGLLFKGNYQYCVNSCLKINVDDIAYLKEKRSSKRQSFIYTEINADIDLFHSEDNTLEEKTIRIKDISSTGMAFTMEKNQEDNVALYDYISVKTIHGLSIPEKIQGRVVHKSLSRNNSSRSNRLLVGVKFKKESLLLKNVAKAFAKA